ncbi:hypothetical protein A2442_03730 [Candidatus Campbellbacteria bacterium RIFOXYC2_FULL_35_25]|uniref:superoxide dismutase n=1 Tax=Candidatus Campbellbacteria bacterium RIFOXYC2_FULL_35_25 TaxID=1797582 RepID=A0A1F5EKD3_9BACT|nr:MAG: hypothetical protein A2442_03730 [Candidatus Campbellbacteria bacterium RIFOXYC2_FULL_35_25]
MSKYQEKQFNMNLLSGISEKQTEEHLKLYAGYVKHANLILEKIEELSGEEGDNSYVISELRRRFSFEFNGMRMHEYYFESLEKGSKGLSDSSKLAESIGNLDSFVEEFKLVGMTRGIGWVVAYFDEPKDSIQIAWVGDHELGQLGGLPIILVMDMWEHAFMVDYLPSEKKKYIEAFFDNINWDVVEERFNKLNIK